MPLTVYQALALLEDFNILVDVINDNSKPFGNIDPKAIAIIEARQADCRKAMEHLKLPPHRLYAKSQLAPVDKLV